MPRTRPAPTQAPRRRRPAGPDPATAARADGQVRRSSEPAQALAMVQRLAAAPAGPRTASSLAAMLGTLQRTLGNQVVQRVITPELLKPGARTRLRSSLPGGGGGVNESWLAGGARLNDGMVVQVDWDRTDPSGLWVRAEQGGERGWLRISKIKRAGDVAGRIQESDTIGQVYASVNFLQGKLTRDDLVARMRLLDDDEFEREFVANKAPTNEAETEAAKKSARACEGFALTMRPSGRRLLLVRRSAETAVMLHESLHMLSNPQVGIDAGELADEGFTEYMRLRAVQNPADAAYLPVKSNYKKGYDAVEALLKVVTFGDLQDAYFNGNVRPIQAAINRQLDTELLNQRVAQASSFEPWLARQVQRADRGQLSPYEFWCVLMRNEKTQQATSLLSGDITPGAMAGVIGPPRPGTATATGYPAAPPL